MKIFSSSPSPFFHRNYAGYTLEQKDYYESKLKPMQGLTILDPMAGHGYFLSNYSFTGSTIWLGDINPGPLILAIMRSPQLINIKDPIFHHLSKLINSISTVKEATNLIGQYNDDWIAGTFKRELDEYINNFDLDVNIDLLSNQNYLDCNLINLFGICLPVIAAREIVTFHIRKNKTWPKPGGLLRVGNIKQPLINALNSWYSYATEKCKQFSNNKFFDESYYCELMNTVQDNFGLSPTVDAIITSPPYANRLDYTRMWYPELLIASIIFKFKIDDIRNEQLGSNKVKNYSLDEKEVFNLPDPIIHSLEEISAYPGKDTMYYYKFFSSYAVKLRRSLINMVRKLKRGGKIVIFIRDTVRKDTLFPTAQLIKQVLINQNCYLVGQPERKIIHSHIGLQRVNNARQRLYGLAQREWWLTFQKD